MNIRIPMVLTIAGYMTLCLMITKPSVNHALAATGCSLTLSAEPGSSTLGKGLIEKVLSGILSCGGTGLGRATIQLSGGSEPYTVKTDDYGNYHYALVGHSSSYTINARYAGDSDHSAADATLTLDLK